ncbi:MAG: type II secretion system protein GspG [Robiginitomaculum sp.]|nr:MAG: type II secretion system protein GspG [Robiginitomaculum sp.]
MKNEKNNQEQKCNNQSGFTLVEVMVTMVIIGLLTATVVINVLPSQDKAMVKTAKINISRLEQAIELYRLDMKKYPEALTELRRLSSGNNDERYQPGGYIKTLPKDPWGNEYLYQYPGEHGVVDIWSYGADEKEGGEKQDADITNWEE